MKWRWQRYALGFLKNVSVLRIDALTFWVLYTPTQIRRYIQRNKSSLILSNIFLLGLKMGLGIIQQSDLIWVYITCSMYLWLYNKTCMLLFVLSMHMTSGMEKVLIMWVLYLSDRFHMVKQLMVWSFFATVLTALTYGSYLLIKICL